MTAIINTVFEMIWAILLVLAVTCTVLTVLSIAYVTVHLLILVPVTGMIWYAVYEIGADIVFDPTY